MCTDVHVHYAVATRTDFLIRGVVQAFQTKKSDTSDDTDNTSGDASDFLDVFKPRNARRRRTTSRTKTSVRVATT